MRNLALLVFAVCLIGCRTEPVPVDDLVIDELSILESMDRETLTFAHVQSKPDRPRPSVDDVLGLGTGLAKPDITERFGRPILIMRMETPTKFTLFGDADARYESQTYVLRSANYHFFIFVFDRESENALVRIDLYKIYGSESRAIPREQWRHVESMVDRGDERPQAEGSENGRVEQNTGE